MKLKALPEGGKVEFVGGFEGLVCRKRREFTDSALLFFVTVSATWIKRKCWGVLTLLLNASLLF